MSDGEGVTFQQITENLRNYREIENCGKTESLQFIIRYKTGGGFTVFLEV